MTSCSHISRLTSFILPGNRHHFLILPFHAYLLYLKNRFSVWLTFSIFFNLFKRINLFIHVTCDIVTNYKHTIHNIFNTRSINHLYLKLFFFCWCLIYNDIIVNYIHVLSIFSPLLSINSRETKFNIRSIVRYFEVNNRFNNRYLNGGVGINIGIDRFLVAREIVDQIGSRNYKARALSSRHSLCRVYL